MMAHRRRIVSSFISDPPIRKRGRGGLFVVADGVGWALRIVTERVDFSEGGDIPDAAASEKLNFGEAREQYSRPRIKHHHPRAPWNFNLLVRGPVEGAEANREPSP